MARPKKDESIRRTKNVMVRFTDVEYALVSCSAEQAGYPVAVYVRKQAITEKLHVHYNIVADIAELRDFARQLSHIGNNLNQIAAFFNSGGIQSRAMLEEINRCMTFRRAYCKRLALRNRFQLTEAKFDDDLFVFGQFHTLDEADQKLPAGVGRIQKLLHQLSCSVFCADRAFFL